MCLFVLAEKLRGKSIGTRRRCSEESRGGGPLVLQPGAPHLLLRARVGARPLAAHGEPHRVPESSVRTNLDQTLDVCGLKLLQVRLHKVVRFQQPVNLSTLPARQARATHAGVDLQLTTDLFGLGPSDAEDRRETDAERALLGDVRAENLQSSPAWNQNKVLGQDSAQERRACGQHAVRHHKRLAGHCSSPFWQWNKAPPVCFNGDAAAI